MLGAKGLQAGSKARGQNTSYLRENVIVSGVCCTEALGGGHKTIIHQDAGVIFPWEDMFI